jgi:rod shape-determining protein MreD
MAERSATRLWGMRMVFVLLAFVILFAHLLPLRALPPGVAGPDLLVAFAFAWVMRRPDFAPPLLIAAVMLMADLLLQRPPGLWAALVLLASEWLKGQDRRVRENTFVAEWVTVGLALAAITLLYRLVLGALIVAPGPLFLAVMQFAMTMAAYPVAVALSVLLFGVRRAAHGEFDPVGRAS